MRDERPVKDGGAARSEGWTEGRPGASLVEAAGARQDVPAAPWPADGCGCPPTWSKRHGGAGQY